MTFISYAQNFEDVMLWRALGHIEHGFYIDLGAWSPVHDSVTAAFYEAGWSGINVEPNPQLHAELAAARPRDINLACAVTNQQGQTELWLGDNSGLGCVQESDQAKTLAPTQRLSVVCSTLNAIVAEHVPSTQSIHFLKIDIEGMEAAVINSTDWQACRPWVVVVEATAPMTLTPNFEAWETTLLQADYAFVYSDGINRFYLASEHSDLAAHFGHPPNYFDQFISLEAHTLKGAAQEAEDWAKEVEQRAQNQQQEVRNHVLALEQRTAQAEQELNATREQSSVLEQRLATALFEKQRALRTAQTMQETVNSLSHQVDKTRHELASSESALLAADSALQSLLQSTSWRITGPLRSLVETLRRLAGR